MSRIKRVFCILKILFITFSFVVFVPKTSFAQVCVSSTVLSTYYCIPVFHPITGIIIDCNPSLSRTNKTFYCNTNLSVNPNCYTSETVCSSNDGSVDCATVPDPGSELVNKCVIYGNTCSKGQCWYYPPATSTPSPTSPPSCNTTSPTNLVLSEVGSNLWSLSWDMGSNGTKQMVFVDTVKANVESDCASVDCFLENTNVDVNSESYSLSGLSEGTVYYARVVTYKDASCSSNSSTLTDISSCDVSPSSVNMQVGESALLTATVNSSSDVSLVSFTPSGAFISLNRLNDWDYPYTSRATAVSIGSGTVAVNVLNASWVSYCSSIADVSVLAGSPWWQVVDGDVKVNGSLTSDVPSGDYFNLDGLGGFPGIVSYSSTTDLTTSNVSSLGWLADSAYFPANNRTLDYSYFRRIVPFETTLNTISSDSVAGSSFESGGVISDGYYWYEYDGTTSGLPLTITGDMSLPDGRSVILLVSNADLNIQGNIAFTSGLSSLVILVNGDIAIDANVTDLQGFILSDGDISTGSSANQLNFKGSIAAQGSINLQRDLGDALNATTPSEVFEYDPSSVFLFPPSLSIEKTRWKEVAP